MASIMVSIIRMNGPPLFDWYKFLCAWTNGLAIKVNSSTNNTDFDRVLTIDIGSDNYAHFWLNLKCNIVLYLF